MRAGIGADHTLPEVGHLEPLVLEVVLDAIDHRPLEEEMPGLDVAPQPLVDLLERGGSADPEVASPGGPQGVAQPRLDRGKIAPAVNIDGREAANLVLAPLVIVPELNAAAVLERDEKPRDGGKPLETVGCHVQFFDHQRVEQPDEIGAGRDAVARPGLVDGARPPHPLPRLDHQDVLARSCQVGCAGQAVVSRPHYDGVPASRSQLADRPRPFQNAQGVHGCTVPAWCRRHDH